MLPNLRSGRMVESLGDLRNLGHQKASHEVFPARWRSGRRMNGLTRTASDMRIQDEGLDSRDEGNSRGCSSPVQRAS